MFKITFQNAAIVIAIIVLIVAWNKKTKEEKEERKKRFANANIMDYLIVICILSVQLFVVVTMYFYYRYQSPPPSELMGYFFAFFGGELLAMAMITITGKFASYRALKKPTEILEKLLDKAQEEVCEEEEDARL